MRANEGKDLSSGHSRRLKLGAQTVELRHAPARQLISPGRSAGDVVRALAWLGPARRFERCTPNFRGPK